MTYIDVFMMPVPSDKRAEFEAFSKRMNAIARDHGALETVDCWGDDIPDGQVTSFPMAVKLEPGETVVFGWNVWPSREARDAGNKAFMEDPRMREASMPFDGKRVVFGGFERMELG